MSEHVVSAFKKVKVMLSYTIKLSNIQPNHELCLAVDAFFSNWNWSSPVTEVRIWMESNFFLLQETNGSWDAILPFWQKIVATFAAIRHYRQFLEGQQFHILTGHKLLLGALKSLSKKYSPRQIRQINYILQYTSDIRHINGVENILADTLSRGINSFLFEPPINIHVFSRKQQKDEHLQHLLQEKNAAL